MFLPIPDSQDSGRVRGEGRSGGMGTWSGIPLISKSATEPIYPIIPE